MMPADPLAAARAHASSDSTSAYWLDRTAELQLAADSVDAARATLALALRRDPYDATALALASRLDYRAGRHGEAIERLEKARAHPEAFPNGIPSALLAGLALHYDAIDRIDQVRALVADPAWRDEPATRAARGYLALRGDLPDSSVDTVDDAVRREPDSAIHQNNAGIVRLRRGDPEGARRAFRAAIDRNPKLPGPYYNLALLETYYAADDSAGRHWFERYWALSHDDPDRLAARLGKDSAPRAAGVPAGKSNE
jgi:tetratricopeptide (TPR) repeat protein